MRHLKLKPFLCKHCSFSNVKKGNLYDHCENIHRIKGGSDEDMIEVDAEQFAKMEQLKEMLRNGQEYDKSLTQDASPKRVVVDRGSPVRSAQRNVKRYKCIHCDFATSRRNGIYSHCEHKHGIKGSVKDVQLLQPEPKFVCTECSSSCVTFAGFLYHHMSHLNIKPFHCRFCTYTSNKKTNLTTHLERVHDSKTVENDMVIDEEDMARMSRLREKLAANPKGIFSMDDQGNISLVDAGDASSFQPRSVPLKQVPKKENLAVPMVSTNVALSSVKAESHPNANKEYSLDTFLDFKPDDFKGDENEPVDDTVTVMGSKPYKCKHCEFNTNKKSSVFTHCELRHGFYGELNDVEIIGKENKFECKVCNMGFVTLPRYVSHVTTHLKIKPYRCAHCDYGSNKKLNVQQHCERIHVQYEEIIVDEAEMSKLNELKEIMAREAAKDDPDAVNPFKTLPLNGTSPPRVPKVLDVVEPSFHFKNSKDDALDQDFQCSNCDHLSETRSEALVHCQQFHDVHPGLDPDACPLVPRLPSGYYQCAKCGEEFKFRQTLLRHLMGHLEITPYLCAHCSHSSRFKSCVRKHAAKMHNVIGDDNDVITDEVEVEKVKLLTNKLRVFYTVSHQSINHSIAALPSTSSRSLQRPVDDEEYEDVTEMEDD